MSRYILALDEGSTTARAVLVDTDGSIVAEARNSLLPEYPHPGWVELDPEQLWQAQRDSVEKVMSDKGITTDDLLAVGVTTHRETCLIWDRQSGKPVHNAIMWMSKQTDSIVERWRAAGLDEEVRRRTGARNDSFFSAAKIVWLLDNVPGIRERAERGDLAVGTVDSWLVWKLTGGRSHVTDHSEASRTALFSLERLDWDAELCAACGIPMQLLPPAVPSDSVDFGELRPADIGLPGARPVPIAAVLGDQQAGMFGQACHEAGSAKNTFGTAGVLTANTGATPADTEGLTSSIAWTIDGRTDYEVEGVVFHSGQTLQWLRERLGVLKEGDDIDALIGTVPDSAGVYFVPAFAGMCAPYWNRSARAGVVGMTLETGAAHVVRAAVEAMAYQNRDNVDALVAAGMPVPELKVDGGGAASDVLCQFQADILGIPVVRPNQLERTALGVAQIAGLSFGSWTRDDIAAQWSCERTFTPAMSEDRREELYGGWRAAVRSVLDL